MTKDDIDSIIKFVLDEEGGFIIDDGGPTNFGITAKYLIDKGLWQYGRIHGIIDEKDMRDFTKEDAINVYERMLYNGQYDLLINIPLATRVFDMAVNSGSHESNLLLQRAYNKFSRTNSLKEDGILGFHTLSSVNNIDDSLGLLNQFKFERTKFYKNLVDIKPEKKKYLNNWLKRAAR